MEFFTNAYKKIKSGGQNAVPVVGSATMKGISAVGSFGGRFFGSGSKEQKIDNIGSMLSEADIKYGDENLVKDDEMLNQYLNSSKPKEVIKALNTILSILVYCTNKGKEDSLTPNSDPSSNEDEDFRTKILKKFYPGVVKSINSENKQVKKLATIIISQTFSENSEDTILWLNTTLKEIDHKDAERRAISLKLLSTIANNETYPWIYGNILKGLNDLNPFVRRTAYASLLKLRKNTDFGATQDFVPEDDMNESDEEEETPTEDLCLKLLRNTLHNISEEEQRFGGQILKPEQNESLLAIALHLLDSLIPDSLPEPKYASMHPIYFEILSKLSEIETIALLNALPILLKYTLRYLSPQIHSQLHLEEPSPIIAKIIGYLSEAMDACDSPAVVAGLAQFFLAVAPVKKAHEIGRHLVRVAKECEVDWDFERELSGYWVLEVVEKVVGNQELVRENSKISKIFGSMGFVKSLFLKVGQSQFYWVKKLIVLDKIWDSIKDNSVIRRTILDEFYYQSKNRSPIIALQAVDWIKNWGLERYGIAETSKSMFYPSIKHLIKIVKVNKDDRVLGRCIQNLHLMLLKDKNKTAEVVYYLVSMLESIKSPSAKARIIKLIIDFKDYFKTLARETFRKLVKNFWNERTVVKFQIIQLGITWMQMKFEGETEKLEQIFNYVLRLALADADYSLKQFTRMVKGIFDQESYWGGDINSKTAFTQIEISEDKRKCKLCVI
jgi:hypothetical protein